MKYLLVIVPLLVLLSCRKKEVDKQPEGECRILSYSADSSANAYQFNFLYDGKKLIGMRTKHLDGFAFGMVEDTIIIRYGQNNKPASITDPSGRNTSVRFFYGADGNLSSKVWYSSASFPIRKMDFQWKNERISTVKMIDYVPNGPVYNIENYEERLSAVLDLQYSDNGNIIYVKRTLVTSMSVTEMRYEYDSQPNPRKNWFELQGVNNSESMYLLSTNNVTKATVLFVNEQRTLTIDCLYHYNENGYPLNGSFNSNMVNVQYECW